MHLVRGDQVEAENEKNEKSTAQTEAKVNENSDPVMQGRATSLTPGPQWVLMCDRWGGGGAAADGWRALVTKLIAGKNNWRIQVI